jgi:5-formyltetrahydrofolate cyclo-ligase
MRDEIDPRGLIDDVLRGGGHVAMPVVEKKKIHFRRFDGEAGLEQGVFGTRHPHRGHPTLDPDFVVAPLAAFDRRGGRIGYGAGYYDGAIADLIARGRKFCVTGISFACQEVEAVPLEPHDQRLSFIATERELIKAEHSA